MVHSLILRGSNYIRVDVVIQEFLVVCAAKDELIKRTQGKAVDELFVFAFHFSWRWFSLDVNGFVRWPKQYTTVLTAQNKPGSVVTESDGVY